jgi:hypothetical protein
MIYAKAKKCFMKWKRETRGATKVYTKPEVSVSRQKVTSFATEKEDTTFRENLKGGTGFDTSTSKT